MRTPGDDIDLVHGLLHSEQVITEAAQVVLARYCAGSGPDGVNTYNVVDVTLGEGAVPPEPGLQRNVLTSSACGVCGAASIEQVTRVARLRAGPAPRVRPTCCWRRRSWSGRCSRLSPRPAVCTRRPCWIPTARCAASGRTSGATTRSTRWWAGPCARTVLPLSEAILFVSSRASFELTQKAVLAGIGVLVAVSAPSSLAVELAEQAGLTLVGFARGDSMNVYTHPERVRLDGGRGRRRQVVT